MAPNFVSCPLQAAVKLQEDGISVKVAIQETSGPTRRNIVPREMGRAFKIKYDGGSLSTALRMDSIARG